jgi:hypothetical protein
MLLLRRFNEWQEAAQHHALPYYGLAIVMSPIVFNARWEIVYQRRIQTWLQTPRGNEIRVTFKRAAMFEGRRIEIKVNNGTPFYFGPDSASQLKGLIAAT